MAFAAVLLLVLLSMRFKRRVAPKPRVVYVQPTPPVRTPDPEEYELVASGIPDDYVATKRQGWLGRNKYKVGAALGGGALGLAYWHRQIQKRNRRAQSAAVKSDLDDAFGDKEHDLREDFLGL
jgi:hypothetical protein